MMEVKLVWVMEALMLEKNSMGLVVVMLEI